ncbi:DNA repair protein rad16 [Coemansia sp. RSA 988]|nr:DNA repair protein rad16 [Coemansia sp. RSA 988]
MTARGRGRGAKRTSSRRSTQVSVEIERPVENGQQQSMDVDDQDSQENQGSDVSDAPLAISAAAAAAESGTAAVVSDEDDHSDYSQVDDSDDSDFQQQAGASRRRGRRTTRRAPTHRKDGSPSEKKAKLLAASEMMPKVTDMILAISQDNCLSVNCLGDDDVLAPPKKFKRKKDGTKTRGEMIHGDDSEEEDDSKCNDVVDVRTLPMGHIDYSSYRGVFSHHPYLRHIWSNLPPPREPQQIEQPAALKIKLLPFQREGVKWMVDQEGTLFNGGILADEMGMGKTLQTIALMLINHNNPTLVVCPTVALLQWKAEIEAATDALSVFVFHGDERDKLVAKDRTMIKEELDKYDVILTTYGIIETAYRREYHGYRRKGQLLHEGSPLHSVEWYRVVLDEAHYIKDRMTNSFRAMFSLDTKKTWMLTGTPLHNRLGELYALIRMTKSNPFSMYFSHSSACSSLNWMCQGSKYCGYCGIKSIFHFNYWNMHILKPIQGYPVNSVESRQGFKKLNKLLDNVMLRRTKIERADDMGLPPRVVVTRRDKFSPEEEDLYVSLFSDYQREFETYAHHGTVLNNYANLFELITRMRLAANHPDLLRLKLNPNEKLGANVNDTLVCSLCNEEAEDPILAKCRHVFCRVDAQMYVNGAPDSDTLRCPVCFAQFEIDLTQTEMTKPKASRSSGGGGTTLVETMMSTPNTTEYRRSIINRIDMAHWKSSTKIEALVEELSRHRQGNANIKSIIFSQFVNFLDLIQWRLNRAGFSVCRLDGRMTPQQRNAVIQTFMTQPEYTVFLVSLKAGGVALNLTEASNVYLADCWWNPSVEVQAMDRIHRMGQYRPIKVTRIIIENSIESRIVALQVKKQLLVSSTIGRDKKSLDHLSSQDMQFLFTS